MLSRFGVFTVISVLTTVLLFLVIFTDDRWQETTEGIILAAGRSILSGFGTVAVPTIIVLGMDAITPLTTLRGRTLPGYFGDVAAALVVAVGLFVIYLSRYQQSTPDDGAVLSAAGQRAVMRIVGVGLSAAALAAGFL